MPTIQQRKQIVEAARADWEEFKTLETLSVWKREEQKLVDAIYEAELAGTLRVVEPRHQMSVFKKAEDIAWDVQENGLDFAEAIENQRKTALSPAEFQTAVDIASGMIDESPEDFTDRMIDQLRQMK